MTEYLPFDINLTGAQKAALQRPGQVVLRFSKEQLLSNSDGSKLLLTRRQINKIKKCRLNEKGTEIRISKRQRQRNQTGGFILPLLATAAKTIGPVAMAALSGMASSLAGAATDKLTGKGVNLLVPKEDLDHLQNAVAILESKNILPQGSCDAIGKDVSQRGGAFVLPLLASLLGTFLPTLFKGRGVYLPWEKN